VRALQLGRHMSPITMTYRSCRCPIDGRSVLLEYLPRMLILRKVTKGCPWHRVANERLELWRECLRDVHRASQELILLLPQMPATPHCNRQYDCPTVRQAIRHSRKVVVAVETVPHCSRSIRAARMEAIAQVDDNAAPRHDCRHCLALHRLASLRPPV
jgi:hypothetical protein